MGEIKLDIQESQEALIAVNSLAILLIKQFRDGIQLTDFVELYAKILSNAEVKEKMQAAYEGVSKIPSEMKDIDFREIIQLSSLQLSFLPEMIEAIKK